MKHSSFENPDTNPEPINNLSELYERAAERRNERAKGLKKEWFSFIIKNFKWIWESATGEILSATPSFDPQTGMLQSLEFRFTGERSLKVREPIVTSDPGRSELYEALRDYVLFELKNITNFEFSEERMHDPVGVIFRAQRKNKFNETLQNITKTWEAKH